MTTYLAETAPTSGGSAPPPHTTRSAGNTGNAGKSEKCLQCMLTRHPDRSRAQRGGAEGPLLSVRRQEEVPRLRRRSGGFARDDGPSILGRELAPDQGCREVVPTEGHLLDVDAGHGVDALAHALAAQPLVEEARRIVGQHPQHGGVAAVGAQLAEQRVEQAAAEPAVLEV